MNNPALDDVRATAPAERLLEDSWEQRSRRTTKRELRAEVAAGALFLVCAGALALTSTDWSAFDPGLAALLVVLYGLMSRIEFPMGAGFAVPSYLVLVPMLVLLPPATVPLLTAAGLLLGAFGQWVLRRGAADRIVFAVPDAWHSLGPAVVLVLAGSTSGFDEPLVLRHRLPRRLFGRPGLRDLARGRRARHRAARADARRRARLGRRRLPRAGRSGGRERRARRFGATPADPAAEPAADPVRARPQRPDRAGTAPPRAGRARAAPPPGRGQPPRRRIRRASRPGCAHRHRAERCGRGARR